MSAWPNLFLTASAYGAGTYNSGVYNGTNLVAIGPLTLPNTGAGWTVVVSAGVLALSGAWLVWLWQHRRQVRG